MAIDLRLANETQWRIYFDHIDLCDAKYMEFQLEQSNKWILNIHRSNPCPWSHKHTYTIICNSTENMVKHVLPTFEKYCHIKIHTISRERERTREREAERETQRLNRMMMAMFVLLFCCDLRFEFICITLIFYTLFDRNIHCGKIPFSLRLETE